MGQVRRRRAGWRVPRREVSPAVGMALEGSAAGGAQGYPPEPGPGSVALDAAGAHAQDAEAELAVVGDREQRARPTVQLVRGRQSLGRHQRPDGGLHPGRQAVHRQQQLLRLLRLRPCQPDWPKTHLTSGPPFRSGTTSGPPTPTPSPCTSPRTAHQQLLLLERHAAREQDRLPHHLLGVGALGQHRDVLRLLRRGPRRRQRPGHLHRRGLDAQRPVGPAGAGHLREPLERGCRELGCPAAGRRLDELN